MKVFHREHADGAHPQLQRFLDWWEIHGPFPVTIPPTGGLRTDQLQAELYAKGRTRPGPHAGEPNHPPMGETVTQAATIHDSAHGRGAALDIMAVKTSTDGTRVLETLDDLSLYVILGQLAKANGLAWGGEFRRPVDLDHVEVLHWRALPIPNPGVHNA